MRLGRLRSVIASRALPDVAISKRELRSLRNLMSLRRIMIAPSLNSLNSLTSLTAALSLRFVRCPHRYAPRHAVATTALEYPLRYGVYGARRGLGWLVIFPMILTNHPPIIPLPGVISEVLLRCIVVPTFIKTIALTYIITDIYIIIVCINISCEWLFTTTLRTGIATTSPSISLKLISIITHTDIYSYWYILLVGWFVKIIGKITNQPLTILPLILSNYS